MAYDHSVALSTAECYMLTSWQAYLKMMPAFTDANHLGALSSSVPRACWC